MELILRICVLAIIGALLGIVLVYIFNLLPPSWLTEYGEEPSDEVYSRERIKFTRFAPFIAIFFSLASARLAIYDISYIMPTLIAIWLLLLIGIADYKYMIIIDQAVVLLLVTSIGYLGGYLSFKNMLIGAFIGFGFLFLITFLGKLFMKREVLGFGDVKLCLAIGALTGVRGILVILMSGFMIAGIFAVVVLIKDRNREESFIPLAPFLSFATIIYLLFVSQEEMFLM